MKRCVKYLFCALLAAVLVSVLVRPQERAEINVLDVGQGDGIYLCTSDGTNVFIDGGSSDVSDVGTYRILPFLKYRGVKKIDYWFVSHSDADHVSGLKEVLLSGYPVGCLVLASAACGEEKTDALAELAETCGCEVVYMQENDALVTDAAELRCIYPAKDAASADVNELSLVLRYADAGYTAIFTGDISAEAERALVEQEVGRVDFYKAAHHGSKYANSEAFLQALRPAVAVISCGENNRYGHPGEEAVAHMREAGAKVYLTMEGGRIRVRYGGSKGAAVDQKNE